MRYDSDDALDRALFALELEEPPGDLRASILTATAYRPAPAFSAWDIALIGVICSVGAWLLVLLANGGAAPLVHALADVSAVLSRALSSVATLAWLAAGGATAIWLSVFTGSQPFALAGRRSERRSAR
ncbi:MAG TPA: hypothetical protein VMH02_02120 [Verrucomicrobiae bacterium]|nr:hypothetical protein [Verrucomicrobiae bacterium]